MPNESGLYGMGGNVAEMVCANFRHVQIGENNSRIVTEPFIAPTMGGTFRSGAWNLESQRMDARNPDTQKLELRGDWAGFRPGKSA